MIQNVPFLVRKFAQRLFREEDGLALTEYLMVLALLVGSVIFAIVLFGSTLSQLFVDWGLYLVSVLRP